MLFWCVLSLSCLSSLVFKFYEIDPKPISTMVITHGYCNRLCLFVHAHNSNTMDQIGVIFSQNVGFALGLVLLEDNPDLNCGTRYQVSMY